MEDDAATRELYRQILTVAGFHVVPIGDGLDALNVIDSQVPSLVVLDLVLPRVGGADVY